MSKNIVQNKLNGNLSVKNKRYNYKDKEFYGACFMITIPKI
jgi:hypothetical protein